MKYPKIRGKALSTVDKKRFNKIKEIAKKSVSFDNKEKGMELSNQDIELLSWNIATNIIFYLII